MHKRCHTNIVKKNAEINRYCNHSHSRYKHTHIQHLPVYISAYPTMWSNLNWNWTWFIIFSVRQKQKQLKKNKAKQSGAKMFCKKTRRLIRFFVCTQHRHIAKSAVDSREQRKRRKRLTKAPTMHRRRWQQRRKCIVRQSRRGEI